MPGCMGTSTMPLLGAGQLVLAKVGGPPPLLDPRELGTPLPVPSYCSARVPRRVLLRAPPLRTFPDSETLSRLCWLLHWPWSCNPVGP